MPVCSTIGAVINMLPRVEPEPSLSSISDLIAVSVDDTICLVVRMSGAMLSTSTAASPKLILEAMNVIVPLSVVPVGPDVNFIAASLVSLLVEDIFGVYMIGVEM